MSVAGMLSMPTQEVRDDRTRAKRKPPNLRLDGSLGEEKKFNPIGSYNRLRSDSLHSRIHATPQPYAATRSCVDWRMDDWRWSLMPSVIAKTVDCAAIIKAAESKPQVETNSNRSLPERTEHWIQNGAPEGQRNPAAFAAACQIRDSRQYTYEEAINMVALGGSRCGLSEHECTQAVNSAWGKPAREPIGTGGSKISYTRPQKQADTKIQPIEKAAGNPLPEPIADGFKRLLETAFLPDEYVSISDGERVIEDPDRIVPNSGTTRTAQEWIEYLGAMYTNRLNPNDSRNGSRRIELQGLALKADMRGEFEGLGAYIRVNPMKEGGKSDNDVAAYRNALVEFDRDEHGQDIPLEVQYATIKASGLPITAILYSGGKSIHAWVKVDASNKQEYEERVETIWALFSKCNLDPNNRNPSRYSRLPDVLRFDKHQRLLEVNTGAANWEAWTNQHIGDGLPDWEDWTDYREEEIEKPVVLIDGILHQQESLIFTGGAKTHKSWTMMELAHGVSTGTHFLGQFCQQAQVFYIDTELNKYWWQFRMKKIEEEKGVEIPKGLLRVMRLKGSFEANIDTIAERLIRDIDPSQPAMVVIDPVYKTFGEDVQENDNDSIRGFAKCIDRITEMTGASVVYSHHHSKGDKSQVRSIERGSGAGTFGRTCETSVSIMKDGDFHKFEFEARNFAPMPDIKAEREGHIWNRRKDLEEKSKSKRADEVVNITPDRIACYLVEGEVKHFDDVFSKAKSEGGYKPKDEKAFKVALEDGIKEGVFSRGIIRDGSKQQKEGYCLGVNREDVNHSVFMMIPDAGVTEKDLKSAAWTVHKFYGPEVERALSLLKQNDEIEERDHKSPGRGAPGKRWFKKE
jgi:RecA-family ATPase